MVDVTVFGTVEQDQGGATAAVAMPIPCGTQLRCWRRS